MLVLTLYPHFLIYVRADAADLAVFGTIGGRPLCCLTRYYLSLAYEFLSAGVIVISMLYLALLS
jgi:hypothetical protein